MALTLHVTSYENLAPVTELSVTVNETDCSIGRASDNDLELPDIERIISHRHATIQFENGAYYLTDNSTNGVYINNAAEPVGQGKRIFLNNGDVLGIGKYECAVSISTQAKSPLDEAMWQPPLHPAVEEKKPGLIIDPYPEPAASSPPPLNSGSAPAAEQNYFQPPEAIREDWDVLTGLMKKNNPQEPLPASEIVAPQIIPEPVTPEVISVPENKTETTTTPAVTLKKQTNKPEIKIQRNSKQSEKIDQQVVEAFLSGAGLSQIELEPEAVINFMHTAGELLREVTRGFRQILITRTSLKNEFRLGMTTLQPAENNPVKFSIDVEDALTKLLLPPAKGYLPPIKAIQEATDDLQAHQMALLSGLRAALSSLIAIFDPEALEKELQNVSAIDNLLPSVKKAKYWELFKTRYREAAEDAENDFLHSLGDEFAIAYEEQIQKLNNTRHNNKQ